MEYPFLEILKEVFADPNRDESLIFELLDIKHEVGDNESAVWFLRDIAGEQDAEDSMVNYSSSSVLLSIIIFVKYKTIASHSSCKLIHFVGTYLPIPGSTIRFKIHFLKIKI